MKILVTSIVDLKKGPHTRLHEFIRHLKITHDITVLCINDWWKSGQTDSQLYAWGHAETLENVQIEYFTHRRISPIIQELASAVSINRLLEKMNSNAFDVHFNYSSLISGYFVAKRMRNMNVGTVYDIADDLPQMIRVSPQVPRPMRPAGKFLGKLMLRKNINIASRVSFVDTNIRDLYPAPDDKAVVIPNGVDISLFYPRSAESLRQKLGLGSDFVIGFVGTMREWVDFEPVFAAVSQLNAKCPNIRIVIVGEEGGLKKARNSAVECSVLDQTMFVGTVPYNLVPEYISCMDVCLIPFAKHKGMDAGPEGFCPLKLAEYLACERPVISSQRTSMPEDTVFYASTKEEYEEALLRLYNSRKLRNEIGTKGRKVVENSYTWSNSASMLEEVLMEVAA